MKNIHLIFDSDSTDGSLREPRAMRPTAKPGDVRAAWADSRLPEVTEYASLPELQNAALSSAAHAPTAARHKDLAPVEVAALRHYTASEPSGFAETVIEPTLVGEVAAEPAYPTLQPATESFQPVPVADGSKVSSPAPEQRRAQAPMPAQGEPSRATAYRTPPAPASATAAKGAASAEPVSPQRPRIGDLLLQSSRLSGVELRDVLALQTAQPAPFGEIAVRLGYVEWTDIGWALSQQGETAQAIVVQSKASVRADAELVMAYQPHAQAAHVIREICSQVLHATRPGAGQARGPLGVMSVGSGDGRTYLSTNLALALAQMGRRVLLIEGDMRKPRLQTLLPGISRSQGLAGALTGRQRLSDAIAIPNGLPNSNNLFVLPAGEVLRDPLELLQQPSFNVLLQKVSAHFDHVLIDTPATADWVDARLVSALAGKALLVARPNHTRMDDLDRLMRSVNRSGAAVTGVVMNARR